MPQIPSYKLTELRMYINDALATAKNGKKHDYYLDEKDIETIIGALEDALEVLEEMDNGMDT